MLRILIRERRPSLRVQPRPWDSNTSSAESDGRDDTRLNHFVNQRLAHPQKLACLPRSCEAIPNHVITHSCSPWPVYGEIDPKRGGMARIPLLVRLENT